MRVLLPPRQPVVRKDFFPEILSLNEKSPMKVRNPGLRFMRNHLRNRMSSKGSKIPSYGYITLETVCNSRCNYCNMWTTKRGNQPTTAEWKTIIEDLAALGAVTLTFSGGEPFLNRDLFELASHARDQGL